MPYNVKYTPKNKPMNRNTGGYPLSKVQRKQVKKIIAVRQELKFKDTFFNTTINNTGIASGLFDIAQGFSSSEREGERLQLVGPIDVRLQVRNSIDSGIIVADEFNRIRIIMFQWHPSDVPVITDILGQGPVSTYDVYSNYNFEKRSEYTIIYDKLFSTTYGQIPEIPYEFQKTTHFRVPLKRVKKFIQYNGNTLNGTDRLYIIFLSDSGAIPHPAVQMALRCTYRDS